MDALNNLSDVLSSVITIIGTKLSEKKPDKKHPFGHGRVEYFSSVIIAVIIFLAGIMALKESIEKIIHPTLTLFNIPFLLVILLGVFVKYFFGSYLKEEGKKLNSKSLIASGIDAINDSILALSTFISALFSYFLSINIEGMVGILISLFILKTAYHILTETLDDLIGQRIDPSLTKKIKIFLASYDEVINVSDLYIHSYGPEKLVASAHLELNDKLSIKQVIKITRKIEIDMYNKYNIIFTAGIYAINDNDKYNHIKKYLQEILKNYKTIIDMHGFYVDEKSKLITFDLTFDFDETNKKEKMKEIKSMLKKRYPDFEYQIIIDLNITD